MATHLSNEEVLQHLAYHVFLPPELPQSELEESPEQQVSLQIARSVISVVHKYKLNGFGNALQWDRVARMLDHFLHFIRIPLDKDGLSQHMTELKTGDTLALYIRAQNTAVLIRKKSSTTVFEVFEVQAPAADVMSTAGKIVRHYPGPAVELSNSVATDIDFIEEISSFLEQMDTEEFQEAGATTIKAGSEVNENRDSTNPNYFIQLFFGILRGMGEVVDPARVVKRVADEVLWKKAAKPWRRSPIWLIIRVAIQTSLDSRISYKYFMAFYHTEILSQCLKHDAFSSDLLFAMRVKMARRLFKIGESAPNFLIEATTKAAEATQTILQNRWNRVQTDQAQSTKWQPSSLDLSSATNQTLPKSRQYLEKVFQGRSSVESRSTFIPDQQTRLENVNDFARYADGKLTDAFSADKHVALFDFEASVFENLANWTNRNLRNTANACVSILSCFQQYLSAATSYYTVDVADQSIMILTLMRLWMAIDQLATAGCPLLLDFSPEIAPNLLDKLLLRTRLHLDQACVIQQHLRSRHRRAVPSNHSIFSDTASEHCFGVQYFRRSPDLQSVKLAIERDAQQERDEKIQELQRKNEEYTRLDKQAKEMSHEFFTNYRKRRVHDWYCDRCSVEKSRNEMKIELHEWPLPSSRLDAELVVFELERPEIFTIWRDVTYGILRDLGSANRESDCNAYITLEDYDGLRQWLSAADRTKPRLVLASAAKPFAKAHYSSTKLKAKEDRVCVKNALKFQLYDRDGGTWVSGSFKDASFEKFGMFKLPNTSSYRHLQYALEGTSHYSNTVLADQANCPQELSLHEHIAFGSLRSGPLLQWMNIVRGLEENIMTFSANEVKLLHTQAAWQIGRLSPDGSRQWHIELEKPEYAKLLVFQAQQLLKRVEVNWLEATSLSLAVLLVSRLLASSPSRETVPEAYVFLREARRVALKWLEELQSKLQNAEIEADILDYQNRVCEMAAICHSTFDVDPIHITSLLDTPDDFTAFVKCSIARYDSQPPDLGKAPQSLQILLCRARRISHRTFPILLSMVRLNNQILCKPISEVWPHYRVGRAGWAELIAPDNRWISTTTAAQDGDKAQSVHFNLLDGQLLIDGKPLGHLPHEYVQHPTYIRLFGQKIVDVVPANSPGMIFATRDSIHGYKVSFLLVPGERELLIRAENNCQTLELVPHSHLSADFPQFLSEDYHHWAELKNKTIEFRPLLHPWSSAPQEWILEFSHHGVTSMRNGETGTYLLDIHSTCFHQVSHQLSPLESSRYILVTMPKSPGSGVLVDLPRMKLSFFLNQDGQLESHNFRGQIVDSNQSTGAMFGLKNQLVLCTKDPVLPRSRSVLIPYGTVQFAKKDNHVSVTIQLGSDRYVSFHRFVVDADLHYLRGDSGLTSRLFKIYLHALTSHCLPDPLTGLTGTEQALSELSEPACSSFDQIDIEQANLLELIGLLTPHREYYPPHIQRMQTINWANLPSLSQHFAFCVVVSSITSRAKTLQLFCPLDFTPHSDLISPSDALLKRATRRSCIYYPPDRFGFREQILDLNARQDKVCPGRDSLIGEWQDVGLAAAWASRLVVRTWGQVIYNPYNLVSLAESWNTVRGSSDRLNLTYSSLWLNLKPSKSWITIYNLCRQASPSNKYALSTCLASAAFSQKLHPDRNLLIVLVAFATNPAFRCLSPPSDDLFDLKDGYLPDSHRVQAIVNDATREIEDTLADTLTQGEDESDEKFDDRQRQFYRQNVEKYRSVLVQMLIRQWPSTQLAISSPECENWFNTDVCLTEVQEYFASCVRNIRLRDHLQEIERVLSSQMASKDTNFTIPAALPLGPPTSSLVPADSWNTLHLDVLMSSRACSTPVGVSSSSQCPIPTKPGTSNKTHRLSALFDEFKRDTQPLNCRYGNELDESREDLMRRRILAPPSELPSNGVLLNNGVECQSHLRKTFQRLRSCLSPSTPLERVVSIAGVWPRITPRILLKQLSLKTRIQCDISPKWHDGLIEYARVFMEYQRSQRLVSLAAAGNKEEFYKELDHTTREPSAEAPDPDWLLVQIEGNFSTRLIQHRVAKEMISPSSGKNTVLQLNMGEGKSSVIVPIIVASLANTEQLVRVVVLKPLWRQMFHLLVNRLSGLAQRRIYYLPFGRHIRVDKSKAQLLQELYEECMREGGILLAQPEHILSFKLMGIDQLISSKSEERLAANRLRDIQGWLTRYARDILDESDEILHVRYQLVYTLGEQQQLEDNPDRWTTTQQVLQLAAGHISEIAGHNAGSVECETKGPGQFPLIRIMSDCNNAIEKELIGAIARDVLSGRISNLNCGRLPASVRTLALKFLTEGEVPYQDYQFLERNCDPAMQKGLLLIRGLLASGILIFALKQKHYRVDYGLDLSRSALAVPYRAKDIPSLRAEFGHPDVAIVLTCLSYYYSGLDGHQLEQCFELLFKLDNPSLEYEQWVGRNGKMPTELRQLNGVNIKDHEQFRNIITPIFSHNSAVVDFFLSFVVFPKAAKDFPHKLSTSGWDLAECKSQVTTGFSGTNDNRYLLPTSITQDDPVGQLSTNALVLTYLLQPENNHYLKMCGKNDEKLTTRGFLKLLVGQKPEIRVLLDVGAQMLELQNEELVRCWLELRTDVEAAIYFNDKDEIVVLPQNGSPSPLYSSPFAQQLDKCIVYLDDGHTRGTDLKLPRDYRALVTLGPKVTKDRLLQGCMRMRNLGHGQSVIFAAPLEIDRQIRSAAPKPLDPDDQPDTLDVLRWAMLETCKDLQHHVSHWAQQGIEYKRRASAQQQYEATRDISVLENGWKTPESRSLKELYAVRCPTDTSERGDFTQRAFGNPDLRKRLISLGVKKLDDASMEEEQEREVIHEIEQEQQVERPPKGEPAAHALRQDVSYFIQNGTIPSRSTIILPLFYPLSTFGEQALAPWNSKLYASTDFLQTVDHIGPGSLSSYMRPVNWIVKGLNGVLVALSPHEVNKLLPSIRRSTIVSLHIFAPRVTKSMRSFSDLDFYSIPSRPKLSQPFIPSNTQLQLDLFAGQLYLSSYHDYTRICAMLGLYTFPTSFEESAEIRIESDGFVKPDHRVGLIEYYPSYAICKFTSSPIPMLKDLIAQRRRGMKYLRTHMGQILHARSLTQDDF